MLDANYGITPITLAYNAQTNGSQSMESVNQYLPSAEAMMILEVASLVSLDTTYLMETVFFHPLTL